MPTLPLIVGGNQLRVAFLRANGDSGLSWPGWQFLWVCLLSGRVFNLSASDTEVTLKRNPLRVGPS